MEISVKQFTLHGNKKKMLIAVYCSEQDGLDLVKALEQIEFGTFNKQPEEVKVEPCKACLEFSKSTKVITTQPHTKSYLESILLYDFRLLHQCMTCGMKYWERNL